MRWCWWEALSGKSAPSTLAKIHHAAHIPVVVVVGFVYFCADYILCNEKITAGTTRKKNESGMQKYSIVCLKGKLAFCLAALWSSEACKDAESYTNTRQHGGHQPVQGLLYICVHKIEGQSIKITERDCAVEEDRLKPNESPDDWISRFRSK